MKEVIQEEQIQDAKQACISALVPLVFGLLFVWWVFYR